MGHGDYQQLVCRVDRRQQTKTKVGPNLGTKNIYVAVLVAAFGGLYVRLGDGKKDAKVYPVVVWFLTIPTFLAQMSALMYLRTELKFESTVYPAPEGNSYSAFLALELMMAIIVYVTNFKTMLVSLKHFVFILNPLTWAEVKHVDVSQWLLRGTRLSGLVQLICVGVWPFVALSMNIFVNYSLCMDSVSLIFSSEAPRDAIFNSLAIGFIVELDEVWWCVCEQVLHLQYDPDFSFELMDQEVWDEDRGRGKLVPRRKKEMGCLGTWVELFGYVTSFPCLPRCLGVRHSIFRIRHGAREATRVMVFVGLYLVFLWQLLIVLQAVDTNVLPVARELCALVQSENGAWSRQLWEFTESLLLVSVNEKLLSLEEQRFTLPQFHNRSLTMRKACEHEWLGLDGRKTLELMQEHRSVVLSFSIGMFLVLTVPTLARIWHTHFVKKKLDRAADRSYDSWEDDDGDPDELLIRALEEAQEAKVAVRQLTESLRRSDEKVAALVAALERIAGPVPELFDSVAVHSDDALYKRAL